MKNLKAKYGAEGLLITGCKDPMRWYRDLVGCIVPYLGAVHGPTEYKSLETEGYVNFVQVDEAEFVGMAEGAPYYAKVR